MIIAGLEVLLFLIPISIVPYLPSFFFGSLLMLFGIEISLSWLVLSYKKVKCPCTLQAATCMLLACLLRAHFSFD
jgi:hypothetical protein